MPRHVTCPHERQDLCSTSGITPHIHITGGTSLTHPPARSPTSFVPAAPTICGKLKAVIKHVTIRPVQFAPGQTPLCFSLCPHPLVLRPSLALSLPPRWRPPPRPLRNPCSMMINLTTCLNPRVDTRDSPFLEQPHALVAWNLDMVIFSPFLSRPRCHKNRGEHIHGP
jgi:hypothetical protein